MNESVLPKAKNELASDIEDAMKLHGHLGPFLVIGVRTGILAKRILNTDTRENGLRVIARLPLSTPFSCVLDGIQATTQCTIGNQKLKAENTSSKIEIFVWKQTQNKSLRIEVNPMILDKLKSSFSEGVSNEELAQEMASMPEKQLFTLVKQ